MKKLIVILLALLLCGCAANPTQELQSTEPVSDEDTQIGLYDPDGVVQAETDGAVRAYLLGDDTYTTLLAYGKKLLLVSSIGDLTLLQGEKGEVAATTKTDLSSAWAVSDLYVDTYGIAYYTSDSMEVVILDERLQEVSRISMPEDMQGKPVVQLSRGEIVYCSVGQIRAIDMQSGISRLIRSHDCVSQELLGSFFDDTIIACMVVDAQGEERVLYLDSETGEKLAEDQKLGSIASAESGYFMALPAEDGVEYLYGQRNEQVMRLETADTELMPAVEINGAVGYTATQDGVDLTYYDLATGTRQAAVAVTAMEEPACVISDGVYVWILAGKTLYRWDVRMSPVTDATVYGSPVYTENAPDVEGLEQCQNRAVLLGQTYGFTLNIWKEAKTSGSGYGAEAEYRVDVIDETLDCVEEVLCKLPEDFLRTTGDVHISLVRSLEDDAACAQYWADGAFRLILAGTEITDSLLWGLGNAVDTRVLGNSFDYDTWDDLNPWWFDYTYDYEENLQRSNPEDVLEGDNRYFTDLVAMSFPTEDRSRLFANAMVDGNEEMFQSKAMQKKLRCICVAIREAYDYQECTEIFTWEQYLSKPIAASK